MPDADMILIIWIKLLTLAGKKNMNGYIFLTENIPYTDEMLSTIFKRPLNTIRLALDIFKKFGMINYDNDGILQITNWEKHQNIEGMEKIREGNKIRQQRFRGQHLLGEVEANCPYCGEYAKLTIDHIISLSKGGSDDIENKILCCWKCNQSKTNRDLAIFLNSKIKFKEPININAITHNKKLMRHLRYEKGIFLQVILKDGVSVTHSNTTDKRRIEKSREDKNKEDIIIVKEIFELWKKILNHKKAKLTNDRITKIKARLKEGYTEEECKSAITGCSKSDYHMGRDKKSNPSNTIYNDIELIFRNGGNLERFISYNHREKKPTSIKEKVKNDTYDWDKAMGDV